MLRLAGVVGAGEGVEEGLERALEQLRSRITWKLSTKGIIGRLLPGNVAQRLTTCMNYRLNT